MLRTINGQTLFTVSFGAGPRTMLLHSGWVGTWEDWLPVIEVLSRDWRVIAYNHRGSGDVRLPVAAITRDQLVQDIFGVLDSYGVERCVLGGFSSGTSVVLRAILEQPERFEGLILANGTGGIRVPDSEPPPSPLAGAPQDFHGFMRFAIEAMTPENDDATPHIRQWGYRLLTSALPEASTHLPGLLRLEAELQARTGEITVPTLLLHGDADSFAATASMAYLASRIPNSHLVIFRGSGHLPLMTRGEEVAAELNAFFRH